MEGERGCFKSVRALPQYRLEVEMTAGSRVELNFSSRLGTVRFGALRDGGVFASAATDGDSILFMKDGVVKVRISAPEFADLILVNRTLPVADEI